MMARAKPVVRQSAVTDANEVSNYEERGSLSNSVDRGGRAERLLWLTRKATDSKC